MSTQVFTVAEQALLFIPDISGFTQFVNDTEISHSQHITEELINAIIEANAINLVVAEVEGDAVLFYRTGNPPTAAELLDQVQRMFIAFHAHLKRYETHRICQCGACCTAINLTLKFFCHFGEVTINMTHGRKKPFGRDVILVHRLMKNNIPGREYALFTNDLIQKCSNWATISEAAWSPPREGEEAYDTGKVQFSSFPLDPLKVHVPVPSILDYGIPGATYKILSEEKVIEAQMELVFDVVSDLSFRHKWFIGLVGSDRMNHQIMQPGSTHRCVIKDKESDPFLVSHDFDIARDAIRFVETNHKHGHSTVISLRRLGKGLTKTQITIITKPNPIKLFFFNLLMKKKLSKLFAQQFENLNDYCKSLVAENKQHPNHIELKLEQ